jgi:hypothetical protein
MSLINDALNKARGEEAARNGPNPKNAAPAEVSASSQARLVALALTFLGVTVILLAVIVVAIVWIFQRPVQQVPAAPVIATEKTVPAKAAPPAPTLPVKVDLPAPASKPVEASAPVQKSPVVAANPPSASASLPVKVAPMPVVPPSAPLLSAPESTKPVTPVLPVVQTAAPEARPAEPPAPPAPRIEGPDPAIAGYVKDMQVRGVGRTKALLVLPGSSETSAYAEGDAIEGPHPLKLVSVSPRKLVFADERGNSYTKIP